MSCYEWERGTFKLSVTEYAKFKKSFMNGMKTKYEKAYEDAVAIHADILKQAKGKRNVDWYGLFNANRYVRITHHGYFSTITEKDRDSFEIAFRSMFRKTSGSCDISKNCRPLKPRKGDFSIKTKQKNPSFSFEEANISFDDKAHTIHWNVDENNHACETAHEHEVGKMFFQLLGKVNWTRGTGGEIIGNDEYNQDCDYAGGGGNLTKASYGPIGKENRRMAFSY